MQVQLMGRLNAGEQTASSEFRLASCLSKIETMSIHSFANY